MSGSWVIRSVGTLCVSAYVLAKERSWVAEFGSSAAVGSSRSRSLGGVRMAMMKAIICLCPPDSAPSGVSRNRFRLRGSKNSETVFSGNAVAEDFRLADFVLRFAMARFSRTVSSEQAPRYAF